MRKVETKDRPDYEEEGDRDEDDWIREKFRKAGAQSATLRKEREEGKKQGKDDERKRERKSLESRRLNCDAAQQSLKRRWRVRKRRRERASKGGERPREEVAADYGRQELWAGAGQEPSRGRPGLLVGQLEFKARGERRRKVTGVAKVLP